MERPKIKALNFVELESNQQFRFTRATSYPFDNPINRVCCSCLCIKSRALAAKRPLPLTIEE